ncbi:MAG: PorT family protein [Chitinophagaceae bacterium]|nr:PorT family protein [Chitinophagaceae bacterium]
MKKTLLIVISAIFCLTAQAQFGVKGGLNLANWGGSDADDEDKKALLGPYFGVFYNIKASDMFSVQPELVYSMQGVRYENSGFEVKIPASYLNLTPLFRYNNPSGFFVGVGPQIGFLLSAKVKEDGEDDVDIKDDLKGIDFSAALAAGYELKNGFGFYVRYNHGLSQIPDEDDVKVYNRVFQVGVRYAFKMEKGK